MYTKYVILLALVIASNRFHLKYCKHHQQSGKTVQPDGVDLYTSDQSTLDFNGLSKAPHHPSVFTSHLSNLLTA